MSDQNLDLFGQPVQKKARSMDQMFGVSPFSIINTVEKKWLARKRRWEALIGNVTESREGTLMQSNSEREVSVKLQEFNNGVSVFDSCLAEVICKWFAVEGFKIVDPFAGGHFGYVASHMGMHFTGMEVRKEQADINQGRLTSAGFENSRYICDTSENLPDYFEPESQDMVFSCPPYLDLEVYSDNPDDLSTMSHKDFFAMYQKILTSTYAVLKPNRFAVIVIGEVRDKKTGFYTCFVPRTIGIMQQAGYHFYNEIILVNAVGTLPLRAGRSMSRTRKVGKRHQNVLVFYKGDDHKDIKTVFPELAPPNKYYNE